MLILNKINKFMWINQKLACNLLNINCSLPAFYSNKSCLKTIKSLCRHRPVKNKIYFKEKTDYLDREGGPNWELLASRRNRFIFPNMVGPVLPEVSTSARSNNLQDLVDFQQKVNEKLHIRLFRCPVLIRQNLHELFPASEIISPQSLTLITLTHNDSKEHDVSAKKFLIAAKEMCSRLRSQGYWADFMNPYSGRPFYSYASGKTVYKTDNLFKGLFMKLEKKDKCLVISADNKNSFSGSIFTDVPGQIGVLKYLLNLK